MIIVRVKSRVLQPPATKDYTITVTRLADVDSSDATLSGLTLH